MSEKTWAKIQEAYDLVARGVSKRVEVDDRIKVYSCGTIIRIDIKPVQKEED